MANTIPTTNSSNNSIQSNEKNKRKKKKPVKPLLQPIPLKTIIQHWQQFRKYSKIISNLYAITYLTGARASEIAQLRKKDIQILNKNGKKLLLINMFTLKNRRHKYRKLPIFITEPYTEMAEDLADWIEVYEDYERLFPYTRQRLWQLLRPTALRRIKQRRRVTEEQVPKIKTIAYYYDTRKQVEIERPYYLHYLRHCRLSHLAEYHHFDALKLMYWAGWTDPKLANIYVRMNWWALAEAIQDYSEW